MILIEDNLYYYLCGSIEIVANSITLLAEQVLLITGYNIYVLLN